MVHLVIFGVSVYLVVGTVLMAILIEFGFFKIFQNPDIEPMWLVLIVWPLFVLIQLVLHVTYYGNDPITLLRHLLRKFK